MNYGERIHGNTELLTPNNASSVPEFGQDNSMLLIALFKKHLEKCWIEGLVYCKLGLHELKGSNRSSKIQLIGQLYIDANKVSRN